MWPFTKRPKLETFSVGDVCIVVVGSDMIPEARHLVGSEVTIIDIDNSSFEVLYLLDTMSPRGVPWAAPAKHLRKKPPSEYDGNQITKWDDCPFKPREMVRV